MNFGNSFWFFFSILSSPNLIMCSQYVFFFIDSIMFSGNGLVVLNIYICVWGQYRIWHIIDRWFVSYAYEVNTSIAYYVHMHMLRMHMKSIPQFLSIWYASYVVCIRGQYLNCVLRSPLVLDVWYVEAICLDNVSWLHHSLAMWCYDFFNICIYNHMYTYLIIYMW